MGQHMPFHLGCRGTLHYVERASLLREDTSSFNMWVWTANPALLPRRLWFTVMAPSTEGQPDMRGEVIIHHEPPTAALEGRRSRLYVHIDVVEDLTAAGRAASGSVSSRTYRSIQG